VRARARTLFHPGESRIAYPAAIRRLYIRFSSPLVSPSLLYALVFVTRALFLFVLPGGTIASSSPFSNFSPGSVYRSSSFSPSVSSPVSFFLSFFFSSSSLPLFFLLRRQSPDALLSFFAVSHTRNARAPTIVLSLLLAPTFLSVGWLAFGVFNLPPSHKQPLHRRHQASVSVGSASGPFVPSRSLDSSRVPRAPHGCSVPLSRS
jgi:hypothetical protein